MDINSEYQKKVVKKVAETRPVGVLTPDNTVEKFKEEIRGIPRENLERIAADLFRGLLTSIGTNAKALDTIADLSISLGRQNESQQSKNYHIN